MGYLKTSDKKRWNVIPILHHDLWQKKEEVEKANWVAKEVDLSSDRWNELSKVDQDYLKMLLAFFSVSDGIVLENLNNNFTSEVNIKEAEHFYNFQAQIESVHEEMYGLLIENYIKDPVEKEQMHNAVEHLDTVRKKAEWALQWIDHPSFAHRLVAFSCVEGLAFSSTFAGIFYYRSLGKMPGMCQANEFIMRDENSHYDFAVYLYHNYLKEEFKIDKEEIRKIILGCYEVEKTFVEESMPTGLLGLNKDQMVQYIKYVADTILLDYGLEVEFGVSQPLEYMNRIALQRKTNFFEKRETEYGRIEIPNNSEGMFVDPEDI